MPLSRRALGGLVLPALMTARRATAATSDTAMFAATRLQWPTTPTQLKVAGHTAIVTRITAGAPSYPTSELRLFFPSFYTVVGGKAAPERYVSNALPIYGASIEYNGQFYPIRFSGASSVTLSYTNGSGVLSDPVAGLALPADAIYFVRTLTAHSLNQYYIGGFVLQAQNGEGYRDSSSAANLAGYLSGGTVTGGAAGVSYVYGPAYAVAKGWDGRPVFLLTGDSIGWGSNERAPTADRRGNSGYLMRGCDDSLSSARSPFGTICIPGLAPRDQSLLSSSGKRFAGVAAAGQPFTHIVDQMGTNGIGGDPSLYENSVWRNFTAWQDRLDTQYPGVPRIKTTFYPRIKATTDNYTTTANQTANADTGDDYATGSRYRLINDIRNFRGGYWEQVVDVLPHGMDTQKPGVWLVPPFSTKLAAQAVQGVFTISTLAPPPIGTALVLNAGGPYVDFGQVVSVTGSGPFSVKLDRAFAWTHPSGARCAAIATTDGTHPTTAVHIASAAAVCQMKNRL